jgi:hypothetical protein
MKSGAQLGLAVAAGYVLGRSHKMKWALGLAALATGKRLAGSKGDLLKQGAKLVSSSPELSNLTGDMRGRLVDAGKSAATAAVSRTINSLSDTLHERSDMLRTAGAPGQEDGEQEPAETDAEQSQEGRVAKARQDREANEMPASRTAGRAPAKPAEARRAARSQSAQDRRSRPSKVPEPRRPGGGAKHAEERNASNRSLSGSDGEPRKAAAGTGKRPKSAGTSASRRSATARSREGRR